MSTLATACAGAVACYFWISAARGGATAGDIGAATAFSLLAVIAAYAGARREPAAAIDADERVAAAEAATRLIIENALDAVVTMDARGMVTAWNRRAESLFGYTRAEAVGRPMHTLIIPPELREEHERGLQRYISTGVSRVLNRRIELPAMRKDGGRLTVELTITAIRDGDAIWFSGFLRDVSDRKRAESFQRLTIELTSGLSKAATRTEAANVVIESIVSTADMHRCAVLMFTDDNICKFVGSRGISFDYQRAVEGHCPWPRGTKNASTILIDDVFAHDSLAAYHAVLGAERIRSLAFIPIHTERGVAGKLMLYHESAGGIGGEAVVAAESAASCLGIAIDRLNSQSHNAELAAAITETGEAVLVTDAAGRVRFMNRAAERLNGVAASAMMGHTPHLLTAGDVPSEITASIWAHAHTGLRWSGRACVRFPGDAPSGPNGDAPPGIYRWIEATVTPLLGPARELRGLVILKHDAEDAVRRERSDMLAREGELKRLEIARWLSGDEPMRERLEKSIQTVTELDDAFGMRRASLLLWDPERACFETAACLGPEPTHATAIAEDVLSRCGVSQIGEGSCQVAVIDSCRCEAAGAAPGGEHGHYVIPLTTLARCEGVMLIFTAPNPQREPARVDALRQIGEMISSAIHRDHLMQELRESTERAKQASRAKSQFLVNMSHEIRTPLTAIIGFADLLSDDAEISGDLQRCSETLKTIKHAGEHLLTVVNDILDLSKIEAGKIIVERIPTDLPGLLRGCESIMLTQAAAKGIALELKLLTPIPDRIVTDPTRLRQILMNLLSNAVKFTERGRVTLTVALERGEAERLTFVCEDSGSGMSAEQAGRIFQAFTQADSAVTRKFGGTGLGLIISKRLARMMGGDVQLVRSEVGVGSSFSAIIEIGFAEGRALVDRLEAPRQIPPRAESALPDLARVLGRVLLAEDAPVNQRLIQHILRSAGAEVEIAENGAVALEMFDRSLRDGKPFDLLLTDIEMPLIDGYSLARELRRRGIRTPIIALTAHAMAEARETSMQSGCNDYATKPIDKRALLSTCARWISEHG